MILLAYTDQAVRERLVVVVSRQSPVDDHRPTASRF
jgi:hypothetical protein